eukprot:scaffold101704_cov55-Attheya_sp.AAC.1
MASLSEYKRRWRKKRLLALLSNNHTNKNTIVCQVEPSVSHAKTAAFCHRELKTRLSRLSLLGKTDNGQTTTPPRKQHDGKDMWVAVVDLIKVFGKADHQLDY